MHHAVKPALRYRAHRGSCPRARLRRDRFCFLLTTWLTQLNHPRELGGSAGKRGDAIDHTATRAIDVSHARAHGRTGIGGGPLIIGPHPSDGDLICDEEADMHTRWNVNLL
jgi:hypothetical protein